MSTSSNPTHRKRLARRYARADGLPYQRALAEVADAAAAGLLPSPLDRAGMAAALETLLTARPAASSPVAEGGHGGVRTLEVPRDRMFEDLRAGDRIVAVDGHRLSPAVEVLLPRVGVRYGGPEAVALVPASGSGVEHNLYPDSQVADRVTVQRPWTRPMACHGCDTGRAVGYDEQGHSLCPACIDRLGLGPEDVVGLEATEPPGSVQTGDRLRAGDRRPVPARQARAHTVEEFAVGDVVAVNADRGIRIGTVTRVARARLWVRHPRNRRGDLVERAYGLDRVLLGQSRDEFDRVRLHYANGHTYPVDGAALRPDLPLMLPAEAGTVPRVTPVEPREVSRVLRRTRYGLPLQKATTTDAAASGPRRGGPPSTAGTPSAGSVGSPSASGRTRCAGATRPG